MASTRLRSTHYTLSVAEPNSLAAQSVLWQAILGFKELNGDEMPAMDPAGDDQQQPITGPRAYLALRPS